MTQEEKELLLRDLCARLPYRVYISPVDCGKAILIGIKDGNPLLWDTIRKKEYDKPWDIEYIKPYLRPLSSMTEEEFKSLKETTGLIYDQLELMRFDDCATLEFWLEEIPSYVVIKVFDWLNAHHFDFRGLIERKLAIKVTKDNNPYEN